jgi:hypothetical protein
VDRPVFQPEDPDFLIPAENDLAHDPEEDSDESGSHLPL